MGHAHIISSLIFENDGCFLLCYTDRWEASGTNQGKKERNWSIETKFPTTPKRSIYSSTEISITSQWSGTGNKNLWKWNGMFQSEEGTTSEGEPLLPGNFHLDRSVPFMFRPKFFGNFGIMVSTRCSSIETSVVPASCKCFFVLQKLWVWPICFSPPLCPFPLISFSLIFRVIWGWASFERRSSENTQIFGATFSKIQRREREREIIQINRLD